MPLNSGTKLGPYEIQSPLGAGGMGEVYRAKDTRLDRFVAVKVLSTHLADHPEIKQRFEREARAISALNHPSICHLYDIGSQDGTDFLVMEFLEGETLADRLRKGAMPLGEILKIGIAMSEALAFAHRHGIVHRDLKPGNVMLTPGGAKLMDFGLAKPLSPQAAGMSSTSAPSFTAAPTMSAPTPLSPLTTAGAIVGTIQYMSPEQIEGKEADARSDIFALGAVLYEMAAGKRPFSGKSQISLASAILENDPPPIGATKPQIPATFEHVVATCLQKNPEERFQSAQDLKLELQWIAKEKPPNAASAASAPVRARGRELVWAMASLGMLVLGTLGGIFLRPASSSAPAIRTVINSPEKTSFNLAGDFAAPPVLSPDGASIVFSATGAEGKSTLWVRAMNSLAARQLAETDGAYFPFWSPDSHSIGFFASGKLKTIDVNGGTPQDICDAPYGRGGAWGAGGVIVFSPTPAAPLMRVGASGGTPVAITNIDASQHTSHRWPFFLPDGKHLLYVAIHHDPAKAANNTLYFASTDGKENGALFRSQSNAVYAEGFLLFARGDQLMAQPFDPAKGTLSGDARTLTKNVMNDASTWHMDASASDNGVLIYGSGGGSDWQLIWIGRDGKQLSVVADKLTNLQSAVLSPRGDRVVIGIDTGENDLWVLDLARGVRTRLTFGPIANAHPVWSPDGQWIAYASVRNGQPSIYRKRSDGSGAEELLFTGPATPSIDTLSPSSWSHDGKELFYTLRSLTGQSEVWVLPLEGEHKPRLVLERGQEARLSPNGKWLAYNSLESGTPEVYVQAYGGGQGKWQVSIGGQQPQWSPDGQQLYYMDLTFDVLSVTVKESGGALQFGPPQTLVGTTNWSAPEAFFDVTPDGKKFLLNRIMQQVSQSVTVVTNFSGELKKQGNP